MRSSVFNYWFILTAVASFYIRKNLYSPMTYFLQKNIIFRYFNSIIIIINFHWRLGVLGELKLITSIIDLIKNRYCEIFIKTFINIDEIFLY
jgi:hypothetical protein